MYYQIKKNFFYSFFESKFSFFLQKNIFLFRLFLFFQAKTSFLPVLSFERRIEKFIEKTQRKLILLFSMKIINSNYFNLSFLSKKDLNSIS